MQSRPGNKEDEAEIGRFRGITKILLLASGLLGLQRIKV